MNILIIAEWFYPASEVAAVRSTKLYKYWKRAGHTVNVITMSKHLIKPELAKTEIDEADIFRVDAKTWLDKHYVKYKNQEHQLATQQTSCKTESVIKRFIKNKIAKHYFSGRQKRWRKKCQELVRSLNFDYDVVFSTFGPTTTLKLGSAIKQRHSHVKWIADFRDQPDRKYHTGSPILFKSRWIKKLCGKADLITCVSEGVVTGTRIPQKLRHKTRVISNGFDSEMLGDIFVDLPMDKLTFAYAGTIYPEDNFDAFFKVINELISTGGIIRDKIELNYAGRDTQKLVVAAGAYGIESIIKNHGLVSREKSLKIQFHSHVMLFTTWNTKKRQGMLKGKFFEQMMMNKPILGLINGEVKNSESKAIFDKTKIGFCYEYASDNYDDLKNYVLDLYNQWTSRGKINYTRNEEEVDKYNYRNIATRMLEEIK